MKLELSAAGIVPLSGGLADHLKGVCLCIQSQTPTILPIDKNLANVIHKGHLPPKSCGHVRFAVHMAKANHGSLGILPLDVFCLSGQAFPFVYGSSAPS